jgi:putative transposase
VYGSPRIHAELRLQFGVRGGRKRVERLVRQAGISGLVQRKRGRETIRVPGVRVADDLVERQFPTGRAEGPVAGRHHLSAHLGGLALSGRGPGRLLAADRWLEHGRAHARRPDPGLIHHSDQGSQFVSLAFGQKARDAGIAVWMDSKGDCYDHAVAESFLATINNELVHRRTWPTRRELTSEIFEYIKAFYNPTRRHSTLGYLSPAQLEEDSQNQQQEQLG